jgi:tRNA-2-methylthio-N6-dimethylallyladenosine synthase
MTDQTQPEPKTLFIETYGCQMNVYDSERMRDVLAPFGYRAVEKPDDADLVILNTCHIREKATEKVYSEIGRIREHKERRAEYGARTTLVVAGCVAQAEGEEIMRRAPSVDIVVGPQAAHKLPELLARVSRKTGERLAVDFTPQEKFDALPERYLGRAADGVSAFLSIQEGCDKFCTFCVVPYTRGAEYSRPANDIVREAHELAAKGVREITLLGQNVNAYQEGGADFVSLIREIAKIPEIARIRYTTSHPVEMDDALIALHGEEEKLMPFLHLPVQSGSDRILRAMNRKHDRVRYFEIVRRLREARPDLGFSTDIIVGFPGETERDFDATLNLIEEVGFASAFSFKYSPRPGTPAAAMQAQIDEDVKSERLARLQALLGVQQTAFNAAQVGKVLPILVAGPGRRPGQRQGRSPYLQGVHFDDDKAQAGEIVAVRIVAATQGSLTGARIDAPQNAPLEVA